MIPQMIKLVLSFMVWSSFIYLSGISNEFSKTVFGLDEFPSTEDPFALFQRWSEKYEKVYETPVEMEKRFQIFETNLNYIAEHNAKMPLASYRLGPTRLADLTPEEFSKIYLNTIPPNSSQVEQQNYPTRVYEYCDVNYTASGVVTPVKDEGQCGSSWAFATTAAYESAYLLAGKGTADFSEQQIIDCTSSKYDCNAGSVEEAFKWVKSNGGIASEASYPYTARKGNCQTKEKAVTIDGYRSVSPESEDHLAYMLNKNGPFVVVVRASVTFMMYGGKTYAKILLHGTPREAALLFFTESLSQTVRERLKKSS
ncbi:hypothetical protein L6164_017455 [Bauhinia variegata]|uniref:Uncharacterized protein n=1 Tax=Bauhinia variegata TaxID=167791 RepID=A0ACB9N9X0_BAUVA|nr:hypothetical protein L6164_017455 [Bauhinia variegata]